MDEDQNLPDFASILDEGPVDLTALLSRRLAWDTTICDGVPELLTALGLTHGSPEGMALDHAESHQRMAQVLPLEAQLEAYASVLGAVLTTALVKGRGMEMDDEDEVRFADQNAEVILAASRAVIANLMYSGVLGWGPAVEMQVILADRDGTNG